MKLSAFTTATLLSATLMLPAFAQEADTPATENQSAPVVIVEVVESDDTLVENETQIVIIETADGVDGAENGRRISIVDDDGNVIKEVYIDEGELVLDDNEMVIELEILGLPHMLLESGEAGEALLHLQRFGARDAMRNAPVNPPMVEATYLGVNCEPVNFDAAALLMIDEGTGLDVGFVAEDSPASAAGLLAGDVLILFNDQLLINAEQLAVLIRTKNAGDTVTLTVVREGEAFEIEAELGTNTLPQLGPGGQNLSQFWNVLPPDGDYDMLDLVPIQFEWTEQAPDVEKLEFLIEMIQEQEKLEGGDLDMEALHEHIREMQEGMQDHHEELQLLMRDMEHMQGDLHQHLELRLNNTHNAQSKLVWNDGEHTLTVSSNGEGGEALKVTDAEGEVLFDGPMPEGEAIDDLPEAFRDKVIELQDITGNGIVELRMNPSDNDE